MCNCKTIRYSDEDRAQQSRREDLFLQEWQETIRMADCWEEKILLQQEDKGHGNRKSQDWEEVLLLQSEDEDRGSDEDRLGQDRKEILLLQPKEKDAGSDGNRETEDR